jgi:hypothetical protein
VIDPRNLQIVHNPYNQTCKLWIVQHASILNDSPLQVDLLLGLLRQIYWPCRSLVSHQVGNCRWNFLWFLVKPCAFDLVHTYKTFLLTQLTPDGNLYPFIAPDGLKHEIKHWKWKWWNCSSEIVLEERRRARSSHHCTEKRLEKTEPAPDFPRICQWIRNKR